MHHTYTQFPKIVFQSNNKQQPNHSPSLNQTNHSSDNQRIKVNCLNSDDHQINPPTKLLNQPDLQTKYFFECHKS